MRCHTRFTGLMCEPHDEQGTVLTADVLGASWCDHCDAQRTLINVGYAKSWPEIKLTVKSREVNLQAGQERYYAFARCYGHFLVGETLKKLESQKTRKKVTA